MRCTSFDGRQVDRADLGAIERVYRSRYGQFCRVSLMIVGDPSSAADVVQEAFARAVRGRASFRGDCPLEAWLWRIVVNVARETARAPRWEQEQVNVEVLEASGEPDWRPDARNEAVRRHVARLPERQRLVLFLRYYADLEYESIAEILDIRVGTVGATLNRAHASLRDVLGGASVS
jgi:RNA polymerase sigma-70 factor (ECF subfamily)